MAPSSATKNQYRVSDSGEWIRITERGEQPTGFYYVRGGRAPE